uniref:Uncharacterized protein n=1 Tax=Lepeophtheirus salmonis TaxID=72036 RepID=A0A0K2TK19_LEPSM
MHEFKASHYINVLYKRQFIYIR